VNVAALRGMACENHTVSIRCEESAVIRIVNAHYGRLDMKTCVRNIGTRDTQYLFSGTCEVVYERSVIMSQCHFNTMNTDFVSACNICFWSTAVARLGCWGPLCRGM